MPGKDWARSEVAAVKLDGPKACARPFSWLLRMAECRSYQSFEFGSVDDDGIGIHGVVRLKPMEKVTLAAKIERVFMDDFDDETILGVDADVRLTLGLSAFASYDRFDEVDNNLFKVGARMHF